MSINPPVQVTFSDRFGRDVRRLGKRYRTIRLDIQPLIEQLESGELPGDQIPDMDYTVFKVRIKNSSIQKGKSGGYRVIYYLKTSDQILLVTMYSKSDQSDITAAEVREILTRAEVQLPDSENVGK
ncbi:type II toxin-antitoxin system RelE/ParE family toxin [Microseira sp. BLCC-F43]|jgi:mRNA-degrading endonuclease RelE of RelBE toxin-antitoxin system|uniref:type II toxin-antitoxin system RelE/ParE family toxin n=1 Tax=Microseira sp. BLCC-F43 TaxID=3153602 RepID=UPI0035B8E7AC